MASVGLSLSLSGCSAISVSLSAADVKKTAAAFLVVVIFDLAAYGFLSVLFHLFLCAAACEACASSIAVTFVVIVVVIVVVVR